MAGELDGTAGEKLGGGEHHKQALTTAWISVVCLVIGFTLCCLALPLQGPRLALLIVGGVVGLLGVVLAKTSNMMENVE